MTTQPTALQLADELEDAGKPTFLTDPAAAELRRLHDLLGKANALARIRHEELEIQKALVKEAQDMAVELSGINAGLLEALKMFVAWSKAESSHEGTTFWERVEMLRELDAAADAAIAKAEGRA